MFTSVEATKNNVEFPFISPKKNLDILGYTKQSECQDVTRCKRAFSYCENQEVIGKLIYKI